VHHSAEVALRHGFQCNTVSSIARPFKNSPTNVYHVDGQAFKPHTQCTLWWRQSVAPDEVSAPIAATPD
jgi:hypothetical protein